MHMQEFCEAIKVLENALPLIKDSGDEVAEVLESASFRCSISLPVTCA